MPLTNLNGRRGPRIAVVGAGPSGFFFSEAIFENHPDATVQMIERLPTPFGMVRGGVAPDHPNIKTVTRIFERIAESARFSFLGNVMLGRDIQLTDLQQVYDVVVLATGMECSRPLGIVGEDAPWHVPAAHLVGWYNGHPDHAARAMDLRSTKRVAVIGNGNVAVDVGRLLTRDPEELASTDISDLALRELRQSAVTDLYLIGRRGPVQGAFTSAEVKELGELGGVAPVVDPKELDLDELSRRVLDEAGPRSTATKNITTLQQYSVRPSQNERRRLHFRFLLSPTRLDLGGAGQPRGIVLVRNRIAADASGNLVARATDEEVFLPVDLVISAIGYCANPIEGVSFDKAASKILTKDGRVCDMRSGDPIPGVYAAGWAETGPRGLIGSQKAPARRVASLVLDDLQRGSIPLVSGVTQSEQGITDRLQASGCRFITYDGWRAIDKSEQQRGQARPRRKYTSVHELLDAAAGGGGEN